MKCKNCNDLFEITYENKYAGSLGFCSEFCKGNAYGKEEGRRDANNDFIKLLSEFSSGVYLKQGGVSN